MKKISLALVSTCICMTGFGQGVSISTTNNEPRNMCEVYGNFVATAPNFTTDTAPTLAQTKNMISPGGIGFFMQDSTGRFYDTGGPNGNYSPNTVNCTGTIFSDGSNTGIEIIVETVDIRLGDSLRFYYGTGGGTNLLVLKLGSVPGSYVFNISSVSFSFKAEPSPFSVGAGYSILFKKIYPQDSTAQPIRVTGNAMYFDVTNGIFQAGNLVVPSPGLYSATFGFQNKASGDYNVALGKENITYGNYAFAGGYDNSASAGSVAIGTGNSAIGETSGCLGRSNNSVGYTSFSVGYGNDAVGDYSLAMGTISEAQGAKSTAIGQRLISNGAFCTSLGMFNDPVVEEQPDEDDQTPTTPIFILGNGDSDGTRSNVMLARKDGSVGIGTNTPRVKLHVNNGIEAGFADEEGFFVVGSVANNNIVMDDNEIMARDDGSSTTLFLQHQGGTVLIGAGTSLGQLLYVNGTAGKPGGGSWSNPSDARLKQNIHSYTDGLEQVLKIKPVTYSYNTFSGFDDSIVHTGVIAQELKEVAPYMVGTSETVFPDGSTGYLQVDNSAMMYMLINAVKELNAKIELLESHIQSLEVKN